MYNSHLQLVSQIQKDVSIRLARQSDIAALLDLEAEMWPEFQRCSESGFAERLRVFNECCLIAVHKEQIVGSFFGIKRRYQPKSKKMNWAAESGNGFEMSFDSEGNAIFGISATVSPRAPKGTLRQLFEGWRQAARACGLTYIYGGSRIPGLHKFAGSPEEYVSEVRRGKIFDAVLSKYLACGLRTGNIIPDYFEDPESRNFGVEVYDLIFQTEQGV